MKGQYTKEHTSRTRLTFTVEGVSSGIDYLRFLDCKLLELCKYISHIRLPGEYEGIILCE